MCIQRLNATCVEVSHVSIVQGRFDYCVSLRACTDHSLWGLNSTALLDISPILQDAGAAMVDDTFLRCFQSAPSDNWNWNLYLFPLWLLGVILRHFIIFPVRYDWDVSVEVIQSLDWDVFPSILLLSSAS